MDSRDTDPRKIDAENLIAGSTESAEELTQKTFVAAWRSRHTFQNRSSPATWIMSIAFRIYKSSLGGRKHLSIPLSLAAPVEPSVEWLLDLFRTLPDRQREAFYLHEVEGYSVEEVAAIVNSPAGTVKARLHFARKNLRRRIEAAEHLEKALFYETNAPRF
jgi:RNA polymerase sigma-70 factor (ECF subfamily)